MMHPIVVRNLNFPLPETLPKHWLGRRRALSLLFDQLSIVFPAGERFFMESVRYFEPQVREPGLRAAIRGFHAQESLHAREHARYNARLRSYGLPVEEIERSATRMLDAMRKHLPARERLAVTCALEHFTALLAQLLLADDQLFAEAPPELAALWRWHAAEENEHAAVAFELFRAVGGGYRQRVSAMASATFFFFAKLGEHQLLMMRADGSLHDLAAWADLARFLFTDPGVLRKLLRPYLAYYGPRFHPRHLDSSELVARSRREFDESPLYARLRARPASEQTDDQALREPTRRS